MVEKIKKLFRLSFNEIVVLSKDIIFTRQNENITRLIHLVKKLSKENLSTKIILDVGAFDGSTSIQLLTAFPECKVLAFEPNPKAFQLAKEKCKTYRNISLNKFALSEKSGEAEFHITVNQVSSSLKSINEGGLDSHNRTELSVSERVKISTRTLDELEIEGEILILKMDVQGHELEVLKGGKNTLQNVHFVLTEMNNHDIYTQSSRYYEVDSWLRENNFKLADIIVTSRKNGIVLGEYDAIYINSKKWPTL